MASVELINKHTEFENIIKNNTNIYENDNTNYHIKRLSNSFLYLFMWLIISILLNILAYLLFINSLNKSEIASIISISSLLFTILSRNHTINNILFIIGTYCKNYYIHQFIYRIGFFHRFMAISTVVWLFVHISNTKYNSNIEYYIILSVLTMLLIIIITALGFYRRKKHNVFEIIHRYFGYLSLIGLSIYYIMLNTENNILIYDLLFKIETYLILFIYLLVIAPWIGTKAVYPTLVHIGKYLIVIKIKGKASYGTYSKITLGNICFHPFGDSMYDFDDFNNRTLYITASGDKTREVVKQISNNNNPLKRCILKPNRSYGFLKHHDVYDNILIVATGGGIAPVIPCLVLNNKTKMTVLWIGHSQEKEFGIKFINKLKQNISNKEIVIHLLNTDKTLLCNLKKIEYSKLIMQASKHYNNQAVFIVSNKEFTVNMVYLLRKHNIKTYGANFDS